MALDDLLISTGVDQLIRLVKEKGRVEIGAAARELKLPARTVEDWAHVLEEEGIIAIDYKLTKVYLAWKTPDRDALAQKTDALEEKAEGAREQVASLLAKVQEGRKGLAQIQRDVDAMASAKPLSASELKALKEELASVDREYSQRIAEASAKLEKLREKAQAAADKAAPKATPASAKRKGDLDALRKELEVLRRFEETLSAQAADNEKFFGSFDDKLAELRAKVEAGSGEREIATLSEEAAQLRRLSAELAGAIEAISEEGHALSEKLSGIEAKVSALQESDGSLSGAKKRLAEIRKMGEEAKRQREAVKARLEDSVALIRKQAGRVEGIVSRGDDGDRKAEELKEEYVEIAEEVSRANEELSARQKEVSGRIGQQMAALDAARSLGGAGKLSQDDLQKASFLLRELSREQEQLEEKVKLLAKEAEILKMESEPSSGGVAPAAAGGQGGAGAPALVEKIKLSEEDEAEFERKREELRALIRKMWEDSKGGGAG